MLGSSGHGAGRGISVGRSLRAGIGTTSSVPRVVGHSGHLHRERDLLGGAETRVNGAPGVSGQRHGGRGHHGHPCRPLRSCAPGAATKRALLSKTLGMFLI